MKALDGARHILVERFGEDAELVGKLRAAMADKGVVTSKVIEEKRAEGAKFSDYFEFDEPWAKVPSHRALALFRGRNEGVLDLEPALSKLFHDGAQRAAMGRAGREVLQANRGALERLLALIEKS